MNFVTMVSWSHDQDGRHTQIRPKPLKIFFFRAQNSDLAFSIRPSSSTNAYAFEWGKLLESHLLGNLAANDHFVRIFEGFENNWPLIFVYPKYYVEPPWERRTWIYHNGLGHITKIATMPIYGKNLYSLLRNHKSRDVESRHKSPGTHKWWPWYDLDQFYRKFQFGQNCLLWKHPLVSNSGVRLQDHWSSGFLIF